MQRAAAIPKSLARPIAIGGLVFFADALLYFAYRYVAVFGRQVEGEPSTTAIAFDIVLFSLFAMHHSVFARDRFRNTVTRLVGPLERSAYVWIASALFIATCAAWQPVAGLVWRFDQPLVVWVLRALQLVGVWLTLRSAVIIDLRHLAGIAQVTDGGADKLQAPASDGRPLSGAPTEFKTAGPYGWVRHPIYSGWFLLVFAVSTMTMTRFVFAVTSSLYLLIAIPLEERTLRRSSAGSYDDYMRKVRWKLVPHVY